MRLQSCSMRACGHMDNGAPDPARCPRGGLYCSPGVAGIAGMVALACAGGTAPPFIGQRCHSWGRDTTYGAGTPLMEHHGAPAVPSRDWHAVPCHVPLCLDERGKQPPGNGSQVTFSITIAAQGTHGHPGQDKSPPCLCRVPRAKDWTRQSPGKEEETEHGSLSDAQKMG